MTEEPPEQAFKRYLDEVEASPEYRRKQARIAARNRPTQFRVPPSVPIGIGLTVVTLLGLAVLMAIGR